MHFIILIFPKLNKKAHALAQTVTKEQPYHLNKAINTFFGVRIVKYLMLILNPTCDPLFTLLSLTQAVLSLLRCEAF